MNLFKPRANEIEGITLREYIDARFEALKESTRLAHEAEVERAIAYKVQTDLIATAIDRRFAAIDRSTELAAAAVEKRLEGMNEFRAQLNTQASFFVTRNEIEDKIAAGRVTQETYEKRMQAIEQGKLNIQVHDVLETRVQALEKTSANTEGKIWAVGVGFTILSTLIGFALHFIK